MKNKSHKDPRAAIHRIKKRVFSESRSAETPNSDITSARHKTESRQFPPAPYEDPLSRLYHQFHYQWLDFTDRVSEQDHRLHIDSLRQHIRDELEKLNELNSPIQFLTGKNTSSHSSIRGLLKKIYSKLLLKLLKPLTSYFENFQSHLVRSQNSMIELIDALDYHQRLYHDEILKMGSRHATLLETVQRMRDLLKKDWEIHHSITNEYIESCLNDILVDLGNLRSDLINTQRSWEKRNRERYVTLHSSLVTNKKLLDSLIRSGDNISGDQAGMQERITRSIPDQIDAFFEDEFRGSSQDIANRQKSYLSYFPPGKTVVDIGCGRGEFLQLLRQQKSKPIGVETNRELLEICRSKNLEVINGDGLEYLLNLDNDSLGGIFCAQVIEHIAPSKIVEFLQTACMKLQSGHYIIIETVNPTSVYALSQNFYRDPSHRNPIHPESLAFFARTAGFKKVEVSFLNPVSEEHCLKTVESGEDSPQLIQKINYNIDRLNSFLFGPQDYAVIARKET